MSPSIGKRLGAYENVSALGAGGMGQVYRATDPRLKRDVALKILPESFASDLQGGHRPHYLATGHLVFFARGR